MNRRIDRSRIPLVAVLAAALALLVAPGAGADDLESATPASIAEGGDAGAHASFQVFAASWMQKMHRVEADQRRNPTVRPGAERALVTYRGYEDDYEIELRATGHPTSPYVGILRYTERVYSCDSVKALDCTVASRIPVTEIFRLQAGRWIY